MLRTRIATALVALALFGGAAALGGAALRALLAALLTVAMHEWFKLAGLRGPAATLPAVAYGALLLALSMLRGHPSGAELAGLGAASTLVWCALGMVVVAAGRIRVARPASILLAITLLSAAWLALDSLLARGPGWLISVLAVVWVADIAAYFTGRALGRHKLAPQVSPGKTWEGVWGALLFVTAAALIVHALWPQAPVWSNRLLERLPWPLALACLGGMVALSVVGDLFESLLKRQAQVKDSGWLLPGHGGVLDRIDATLPALPAAVLMDWWMR